MNNKTRIVFISGMFAGGWIWEKVLTTFPNDQYEVKVINQPLGEIGSSIDSLLDFVNRNFIDNYSGKVILVGNSLGSLIALKLALKPNNNVIGCVLSGSPGMENINLGIGKPKPDEAWLSELSKKIFVDQTIVTDDAKQAVFNFFSNRNYFRNIISLTRETNTYHVVDDLAKIPYSTYLLWGEKDQITPVAPWNDAVKKLDNCFLYTLKDCGHSPMYEKPNEFNILLMEAFSKLEKADNNA